MPSEKPQSQLELVESLASTIHKKIMAPAEDRMETVNRETKDLRRRVAGLEQKVTQLAQRHNRTRLLACVSLVAAGLLAMGQIFSYVR